LDGVSRCADFSACAGSFFARTGANYRYRERYRAVRRREGTLAYPLGFCVLRLCLQNSVSVLIHPHLTTSPSPSTTVPHLALLFTTVSHIAACCCCCWPACRTACCTRTHSSSSRMPRTLDHRLFVPLLRTGCLFCLLGGFIICLVCVSAVRLFCCCALAFAGRVYISGACCRRFHILPRAVCSATRVLPAACRWRFCPFTSACLSPWMDTSVTPRCSSLPGITACLPSALPAASLCSCKRPPHSAGCLTLLRIRTRADFTGRCRTSPLCWHGVPRIFARAGWGSPLDIVGITLYYKRGLAMFGRMPSGRTPRE